MMNKKHAEEIIGLSNEIDVALDKLTEISKLLPTKEGENFRKRLSVIIIGVYEQINKPVYAQYPELDDQQ